MSEVSLTAGKLRDRFRAIPSEQRHTSEDFCIRVWRAVSWLERAEKAADGDLEGRFIPLWISFNALYGRMENDVEIAADHASWQAFLSRIFQADGCNALGKALSDSRLDVLRMIESPYLFRPFWLGEVDDVDEKLGTARRQALNAYNRFEYVATLHAVFERLYVLRQQIFHGAATEGSRFNRHTLKMAVAFLSAVLPAMISIMIDAGPETDWGGICYPPVTRDGH